MAKKKKKLNHLQQRQRKERLKKLALEAALHPKKFKAPKIQSKSKAKTRKQKERRRRQIERNPQHGNLSAKTTIARDILVGHAKQYSALLNGYLSKIRPEALERVANNRIYGSGNVFYLVDSSRLQLIVTDGVESAFEEFMDMNFSPYDYKDVNLDKGSKFDDREEF